MALSARLVGAPARLAAAPPRHARALATRPPLLLQAWGANTGVGKTVACAALLRAARGPALFVKPVQTGAPRDDDAALVRAHAPRAHALTLHAFAPPLSPDVAAARAGASVPDAALRAGTSSALAEFVAAAAQSHGRALALVETAGGVLSPAPSGSLQADVFRPLRLPALLVGDPALGGISATLAAYEALRLRGYDVPAVVLFADRHGVLANETSVEPHVDHPTHVFQAPPLPPPHVSLTEYFARPDVAHFFANLSAHLDAVETDRRAELQRMPADAANVFWYPYTQHARLADVTCIDSAHGDRFTCATADGSLRTMYDAIGSWWTNGVGHGNPAMARAVARAAGRYGHVMFPEAAHEPALALANTMLRRVGAPWASRVFFSDDGSTAVEVALKMAFRRRARDAPQKSHLPVKIVGLEGSYHGDTLGVMDCSQESDFNTMQTPWYQPRGVFFDPPTASIRDGVWVIQTPPWLGTDYDVVVKHRDELFSQQRNSKHYEAAIRDVLHDALAREEFDLGALLIEPLMLGSGGMQLVDPAFQRALVAECRRLQIPVIFDEVFTGLWRLGRESAAELLACAPDIAAYGKLLTGGTVPMAVTLASERVFDAFDGASKREALLHGHSYTAHAIGCEAAVESLRQYEPLRARAMAGNAIQEYWSEACAREISSLDAVERVTVLGTVLAVAMRGAQRGYAATGAVDVVQGLKDRGVFARPLGNVVYVMCSPLVEKGDCERMMATLMEVLEASADGLGKPGTVRAGGREDIAEEAAKS